MVLRVALTGTPGTGKTAVARELALSGWGVLDVADLARVEGFVLEEDPDRPGTLVVDEVALAERLAEDAWPDGPVAIDSHFAHVLPAEIVVVLRCEPLVLADRLRARKWPEAKVRENVEAEALSLVAEEVTSGRVLEVDTTGRDAKDVAGEIRRAVTLVPFPARRRIGWDAAKLPWL